MSVDGGRFAHEEQPISTMTKRTRERRQKEGPMSTRLVDLIDDYKARNGNPSDRSIARAIHAFNLHNSNSTCD